MQLYLSLASNLEMDLGIFQHVLSTWEGGREGAVNDRSQSPHLHTVHRVSSIRTSLPPPHLWQLELN